MKENKIGLIAGQGDLPIIFSNLVRKKGIKVITVAIKDEARGDIANFVDKVFWISIGEPKKGIQFFKDEQIRNVVMLGKIKKTLLYADIKKDTEAENILKLSRDKRDDTLLKDIANKLRWFGLIIQPPIKYLKEFMPEKGTLTEKKPSLAEWEDIKFGFKMAKAISGLDIGQTVVVKNKSVLAVESIEGTDEAIKRGGKLCGNGAVVTKVAKPNQDMRFDVPLVGKTTIQSLIEAKASVLALERRKSYLIDKSEIVKLADDNNISVVIV